MKVYVKTFINPILALAFKEGVDFVGDPDYKAMDPKKEGEEWEVLIEHDCDDEDEDDDDAEVVHSVSSSNKPESVTMDKFDNLNLKDWVEKQSKRISSMEIEAQSAPSVETEIAIQMIVPEIIHLPVKTPKTIVPAEEPEPLPPTPIIFDPTMEPCGACLNCATGNGEDCINIVNAACLAAMPHGTT